MNLEKIPVTVIVPTKNEESNLRNTLPLLKCFSEVFVVDSNSKDKTKELTIEYRFNYVEFTWNGRFPKKRNWALMNLPIKNNWVLFLDADEFVTDAFINELSKIFKSNFNGYWINYDNYFLNKHIKHGDPMRKLSLFRVGSGMYEKIEEANWSNLDMEVHEHPIIEKPIGCMNSHIVHNDFRGLEHYIAKHNEYSSWEASRYLNMLKKSGLTFRQKVKYSLLYNPLFPLLYFCYSYIVRMGFLDGYRGLIFNLYKSIYFFQVFTKIYSIRNK
ncbi:MAG: glycosyltransferase family 2 protein [Ignavibacteriaceae bacterium]|nr:glycosyltransferase family 2 protein [Ignavibacteriaceae bacterium]